MYAANRPTRKSYPRVSYVIRTPVRQHCLGVNSLCFNPLGNTLFSCGRDGIVISWDVSSPRNTRFAQSFEGHADWVNDAFVCSDNKTLISCSSDHLVKSWDISTGNAVRDLYKHTDYVRALAYAKNAEKFASGGFDKVINIWDVETARSFSTLRLPSATGLGHKHSIYSLGCNPSGTIFASGSSENVIRIWDGRTGTKICKLKGHKDNVRAVLVDRYGLMCISASSDQTIRLWDLGQQRCVQSYDPHTDSVWSLHADDHFSKVVSGSRDGTVYVTDLKTKKAVLICREPSSVHKAIPTPDWSGIWVATPDSSMSLWEYDENRASKSVESMLSISTSPSSFTISIVEPEPEPVPLNGNPVETIQGKPGIKRHRIYNNKRHVLTCDTSGSVALWDVTKGIQVADYGKADFDAKVTESSKELLHVPNWFTVDTRTGALNIHLDNFVCFNAEIYAADAEIEVPNGEDIKINLGDRTMRSLFASWIAGRRLILEQQARTVPLEESQSPEALGKPAAALLPQDSAPTTAHDSAQDSHLQTSSSAISYSDVQPNLTSAAQAEKTNSETPESKAPADQPPSKPTSPSRSYSLGIFNSSKSKKNTDGSSDKKPSTSPPKVADKAKESDENTAPSESKELPAGSDIPTTLSFSNLPSALTQSLASVHGTLNGAPLLTQPPIVQMTSQSLPPWPFPPEIQVYITEEGYTQSFRVGDFTGSESIIPEWVDDCVMNEKFTPKEQPKISFFLLPCDAAQTPSLPHGNNRLIAHRVLKLKRIAAYIVNKLGVQLPTDPTQPSRVVAPEDFVKLYCNDQALDVGLNLGTIRHLYWKSSSDEMQLKYEFRV
eukprot:TRINITY_DN11955_c0_g1_i1.p1 TRINITY_DN11955_c0_g1~~TRINITY_DN11955_c0_g1_i1.p1  ORF type:complete len:834 (+),score=163.02 TRINITY_DN11955_c0_g1_i1:96-2597(+)